MKTHIPNKDFARRLTLKERLKGARKWPINGKDSKIMQGSPGFLALFVCFFSMSQLKHYAKELIYFILDILCLLLVLVSALD